MEKLSSSSFVYVNDESLNTVNLSPTNLQLSCGYHLHRLILHNLRLILTWREITTNTNKLQTFINRCLRQILNIRWPNKITNENLLDKTKQIQVEIDIKKRKWGWIRHTEKTTREYHKTITQLEPTGDQKSWNTKADLEKKCGDRSEDSRMDLGLD
jgi:hypothetical protein